MRLKNYLKSSFFPVLFLILVCFISQTAAQEESENKGEKETKTIEVVVTASKATVVAGQELTLTLKLKLGEGMHANSDTPKDPNLIATRFIPDNTETVLWSDVKYPLPTEVNEWYSTEPLSVFEDGAEIIVPLKISTKTPSGKIKIGGKLRIQACDNEKCYPAKRIPINVELTITDKNQ